MALSIGAEEHRGVKTEAKDDCVRNWEFYNGFLGEN